MLWWDILIWLAQKESAAQDNYYSIFGENVMETANAVISIFFVVIGLLLCFGNRFKKKSLIRKMIYWISQYAFFPKNKYNHIIWGSIIFTLGFVPLVLFFLEKHTEKPKFVPQDPLIVNFESWWYKDPMLWIVIVVSVALMIYRSKQK